MNLNRREALWVGLGGLAAAALPRMAFAAKTEEAIAAFAGGATVGTGGITLTAPEIAENGNTVPVAFDAPGAVSVMLLASGNPEPLVAIFNFGAASGSQKAATRIRLSKTQDVVALAKMADGSVVQAQATVKVTIGGCGG